MSDVRAVGAQQKEDLVPAHVLRYKNEENMAINQNGLLNKGNCQVHDVLDNGDRKVKKK